MSKNVKKRNWAFVLYPESAPEDWKERLQKTGLEISISPLHDKDKDPDGKPKKPHYHIMLCFPGPTTYNVVKSICDELNQPIPQAIESVRGYYRYFTHMDNPDKYQYDQKDIVNLGGFNISDYVELTKSEVGQIKRKLHCLIREQGIVEYSCLMEYLLDNEMYLEYDVASCHTLFFDRLITSSRHYKKETEELEKLKKLNIELNEKVDPETGEVLE